VPATEAVDSFDVGSPGTRRGADLEATPLLRTSAWVVAALPRLPARGGRYQRIQYNNE